MPRIDPIDMDRAEGRARELLEESASRGGEPAPTVRAMATAPALLRGYLDLNRGMKRAHLDRRITEQISLAVHDCLGCEYCLIAHTRAARDLGPSETDIQPARQGTVTDPRIAAMVSFGQHVLAAPAEVTDEHDRTCDEEHGMSRFFSAWAAAVGAAGCGRCAAAT